MNTAPRSPYGYTIFCDDIREEVGGKLSFMGVYQGSIVINGALPVTLPKFAAMVHYNSYTKLPNDGVELYFWFPGDPEDQPQFRGEIQAQGGGPEPEPDMMNQLSIAMLFAPVTIKTTGLIKVRAKVNGDIIKLGTLRVEQGTPASRV